MCALLCLYSLDPNSENGLFPPAFIIFLYQNVEVIIVFLAAFWIYFACQCEELWIFKMDKRRRKEESVRGILFCDDIADPSRSQYYM